jgi:hypothetical protein
MLARLWLLALAATVLTAAASADDKKPQVIEGFGTVTDPDGDSTVKAEKGKLIVIVPKTQHDLRPPQSMNAPRILQEVEGDFSVTVKVTTGELNPGEKSTRRGGHPFIGAGLLLWQDEKNFLRLERNAWRGNQSKCYCHPPLIQHCQDGKYQNHSPGTSDASFFQGDSTYLMLDRRGDNIVAAYSHDGEEWSVASEMTIKFDKKVRLGVAASNTGNKPFQVEFEQFKLTVAN